jgi:hypothetical protein
MEMLPKKSKLRCRKELEKFTREWKPVSETTVSEKR